MNYKKILTGESTSLKRMIWAIEDRIETENEIDSLQQQFETYVNLHDEESQKRNREDMFIKTMSHDNFVAMENIYLEGYLLENDIKFKLN